MYAMKYPLIMDCQPRKIKSETNPILSPALLFNTPGVAIVTQLLINFNHPFPQNLEKHHKSQRDEDFKFFTQWPPPSLCHMTQVMCQIPHIRCHTSGVTCHLLPPVKCHVSHVTCHMSCVTWNFF